MEKIRSGNRQLFLLLLSFLILSVTSYFNYLLFHSFVEIFSVVIASHIFIIGWNSRKQLSNDFLLYLGISYLFVVFFDLLHTLSYRGMGILYEEIESNLATQLWIVARYIESVSLLIAFRYIKRPLRPNPIFVAYTMVAIVLLTSIFYWKNFPICFEEGVGLTLFKKISEYLICGLLFFAILLIRKFQQNFAPYVYRLLIFALLSTIAAELFFTFYISAYGISNQLGHYLKVISFYLIYKAIIETGLIKPQLILFKDLEDSKRRLQHSKNYIDNIMKAMSNALIVADPNGKIETVNQEAAKLLGYKKEELIGLNFSKIIEEGQHFHREAWFKELVNDGMVQGLERHYLKKNRQKIPVLFSASIMQDEQEKNYGMVYVAQDLTNLKKAEEKLSALHELLPICRSCKKIKDDHGYWQKLEQYMENHCEVTITPGLCKKCSEKIYKKKMESQQEQEKE